MSSVAPHFYQRTISCRYLNFTYYYKFLLVNTHSKKYDTERANNCTLVLVLLEFLYKKYQILKYLVLKSLEYKMHSRRILSFVIESSIFFKPPPRLSVSQSSAYTVLNTFKIHCTIYNSFVDTDLYLPTYSLQCFLLSYEQQDIA